MFFPCILAIEGPFHEMVGLGFLLESKVGSGIRLPVFSDIFFLNVTHQWLHGIQNSVRIFLLKGFHFYSFY